MIKINKDILEKLTIKTVYALFDNNGKVLTVPIELYSNCWKVYIGADNINIQSFSKLEILKTDDSIIAVNSSIKKINGKYKQYIVIMNETLPLSISAKIKNLQDKYGAWEKRSGIRINAERANHFLLGLKIYQQIIALNGFEYSCIIEDISVHGIRVKFEYPKIRNSFVENVLDLMPSVMGLKLAFLNPLTVVFLMLEPKRIHFFERENGRLSVGCRIKEPINISFIDRISEAVKKIEGGYVVQQER